MGNLLDCTNNEYDYVPLTNESVFLTYTKPLTPIQYI